MDLKDVRLVVTDMDGTLLDSHHRVSDRFFKLQEALSRRGVRFAAASGRQYQSIAVKLTHILEEVFIIAENGGLLRHRDEELLSTPLDPALRDEVLTTLEGIQGAHTVLCGKDRAYLRPPTPAFREQLTEYYTDFEYIDPLRGFGAEIMKIAVYHFESSETHIYPAVKPFENRLKVKVSGAHWVDLSDPKAHKGHALELLQDQLVNLTRGFSKELDGLFLNLTRSEMLICSHIQSGRSSKEIAEKMNISLETVLTHRRNIRKKLGLRKRRVNLYSFLSSKPFLQNITSR